MTTNPLVIFFPSFFRFYWYFDECREDLAAGYAAKLILQDKVDVIFGPSCSTGNSGIRGIGSLEIFPH
jgi:hypothetical protein